MPSKRTPFGERKTPSKRGQRNPVLQHYQVEVRGNQYYVIDTKNGAIVGGPFKDRTTAQEKADTLERRRPHRG